VLPDGERRCEPLQRRRTADHTDEDEEGIVLPGVKVKDNETFESAMKRFKKQCEKAGIMYELRRREHYEKPSVRKKKKALAARKRALKKLKQQVY
jgi:small subunit ribosomal protein S21